MDPHRLDDLCASLTNTSISRRTSLKLFAATALAGVSGLTQTGSAAAATHCRRVGTTCRQTSECCGSDIGTASCSATTGRCQCISDPTVHLCSKTRQCVGCPEFDMGFNTATCACTCAAGASACGSSDHCCFGDTCSGGTCVGACTGGTGTCDTGANSCGGSANCFTFSTAEGSCVCGAGALCVDLQPCTSSAQCPSGTACTVNTCCGGSGVCTPLCANATATAAAAHTGGATNYHR
jgi:hypothetical protein